MYKEYKIEFRVFHRDGSEYQMRKVSLKEENDEEAIDRLIEMGYIKENDDVVIISMRPASDYSYSDKSKDSDSSKSLFFTIGNFIFESRIGSFIFWGVLVFIGFIVISNWNKDTSDGGLIGTWIGTVNNYNNTKTHYTITIESNGSCKIIEKDNNETYTYLGIWETKSDYIGDSKRYDWIQLEGATKELYEYTKQDTYKSTIYGELRGAPYKLKSIRRTTLTMTPDGKIWGASLDARTLVNNPNDGTQLIKQN